MRILLAEDDDILGSGLRAGLMQHGFQVDWVRDGIAAERELASGAYFDCVTNYAFRARNTGIAAAFERFASPASVVAWRSSPAHAVAFARLPRGR